MKRSRSSGMGREDRKTVAGPAELPSHDDDKGGSKQHVLPAALIGQFSDGRQKRFRSRNVFVLRRSGGAPVSRSADRLAWQSDYYGPHTPVASELNVDGLWTATESGLPQGIEHLQENRADGTLSLREWLWILVPFVSSVFARGIDFEVQFDERMRQLLSAPTYDEVFPSGERRRANTNRARLIEVVRLLSPVMSASWRIMHNPTARPLILNDRGFALYRLSEKDSFYGLPLTPRLLVLLRAGLPAPSMNFETARVTGIEHRMMSPEDVERANRGTVQMAIREIYGPTADCLATVGEWSPAETVPYVQLIGAEALIPPGFDLRFHEADWFAATGKFRAKQNYLPRDPGFGVLIRMDLPMLPAQAYGLAQRTLDWAEGSLHSGRGEVALEHCATAAERDPEAVAAWLRQRLRVVRFRRKRGKTVEEVVDESTALLESADASAYEVCVAALRLALVKAGQGSHMEARTLLHRVAVTSKDYELARIRGAVLMEAYGDRDGAIEALKGVTSGQGSHLAEEACRIGELMAQDDMIESEQWLRTASEKTDPWAARALFRLANQLRERGDGASAIELYSQAEGTGDPHWGAAATYNHGVYLMETGDKEGALGCWRQGFASTDSFWKAYCANALGGHLFSAGGFAEARPYLMFTAAARIPDIKDAAALNLGIVFDTAAEYENARYWLQQVVAEASGELPLKAHLALSNVAEHEGFPEAAIGHLNLVATSQSATLAADALFRWGRIVSERPNAGEAADLFQRAMDLDEPGPREAAALQLALLADTEGDLERALALAKVAVASPDPDTAAKAATLAGTCSRRLGEQEEALEFFRLAAESTDHRQSVIGQANLGGLLVDTGQLKEGIRVLRKAKGSGGPGAVFAALNLAEYFSNESRPREAEREYRWAMSTQAERYRVQAALPYAEFLASLGRIREAREVIDGVMAFAGPRMRQQLATTADQLKDVAEGVATAMPTASAVYVETADEKRPSRKQTGPYQR